jgi:MYXO-CTERM domain-containing protein
LEDTRPHRRRGRSRLWTWRSVLAIWATLSTLWAAAVTYNLYHRVNVQVAVTHDVQQDLDFSSCDGSAQCMRAGDKHVSKWSDIASTYVRFGQDELIESALGPPAMLLAVVLAALTVVRRRYRAMENAESRKS